MSGPTLEQAVFARDRRVFKDILEDRAWVVDARGDRVGLGSTMQNGLRLVIRRVDDGDPR